MYVSIIAVFVAYFLIAAIATFFTAALTYCAAHYFTGQPISFRDGIAAAWRARRKVLVWALASATVGVGLRIIEERFEIAGAIAATVFGIAWGAMTFFIVPVMVLDEDATARGMFHESAETLKEKWGESAGSLGVGMVIALTALIPILVIVALAYQGIGPFASVVVSGALVVAVVAMAVLLIQTFGAIARTALYLDAHTGMPVDEFADLDSSELVA